MNFPDLSGLFWFALIGVISSALLAIGAVGGLIWFIVNHVRFV